MRTDTPVPVKLSDYRPYPFEIERVQMTFQLDAARTIVRTVMSVQRTNAGDMVLNGEELDLIEIKLDGVPLDESAYHKADETLTLPDLPDAFELETRIAIAPDKNTALSGLYVSGGRLCTQCESHGFRRITYWPDRPDVMSRYSVRLEGDAALYPFLLCNGTPGAAGELGDGRHFAEWDDPHPKPSYLFALCAGDYDVFRDRFTTMGGREVDLAVHVDKGDEARAAYAMDSLIRSMKWDEDVFGREYDLGVFNIVAVRDFNFGAMENKGLNVFNSAYVLADADTATDGDYEAIESIVAHEYFHNWTGNRITCRDWFQLCLKEGLTVFRDQWFSADMRSAPVQRIKSVINLRARQFAEDAGPLAHPVRPDSYASVDNLYTATVYEKGSELIGMLKVLIGDTAFAKGMDLYFDRHDGDAATIEDFYACFEEASGQNLKSFRRWYAQPGTPHVRVRHTYDVKTGAGSVSLVQSQRATDFAPAPKSLPIPLRYALIGDGSVGEEHLFVQTRKKDRISYQLPEGSPKPLLSLNRGFGAPITLDMGKTPKDLIQRAEVETDPFNRWDALQTLVQGDLLALANGTRTRPNRKIVKVIADAVAGSAQSDPAYAALLLRLPSVSELFQHQSPARPLDLTAARTQYRQTMLRADAIQHLISETFSQPGPAPFEPTAEQAGIRALRGGLTGLMASGDKKYLKKLAGLYATASNMTEQLSALQAIVEAGGVGHPAVKAFYDQWKDAPLVMDKWFRVQAMQATSIEDVDALLNHPDFTFTNPNRVRAVAGAFAMANLALFHAPDGSGYTLLSDVAVKTDASNAALASRLLTAFEQWRQLEPEAKAKAEAVLTQLSQLDLSKNAMDIVGRSLAAPKTD
ncbi:MAG: aminopeptidase N [Pseudomonadota bacterium]